MAISNPYLADQANAITNQVTGNLQRNILPGINRGAIAAGGYGGSRQGIAQAGAIGQTNDALSGALSSMYGQAYDQDANRANQASMQSAALASQQQIASMQDATNRFGLGNQYSLGQGNLALGNKQADQNYALGQGNLGLGYQNSNQNFYSTQRGQDLQAQQQGFNQYLGALNQQLGMGQQQYQLGQQQMNAPMQNLQGYGQALSPFTGLNESQNTTTPSSGGGLAGAAGGALTMAQLLRLLNGG